MLSPVAIMLSCALIVSGAPSACADMGTTSALRGHATQQHSDTIERLKNKLSARGNPPATSATAPEAGVSNAKPPSNPSDMVGQAESFDASWAGRMRLREDDLENLGLKSHQWWLVDNIFFPDFRQASPETRQRLIEQLQGPPRRADHINWSRDTLRAFLETGTPNPATALENVVSIISEYSRAKDDFYKELRHLRDQHYANEWWGKALTSGGAEADVVPPLESLRLMVDLLGRLEQALAGSPSPTIQQWRLRIQQKLKHPDIELFKTLEMADLVERFASLWELVTPSEVRQKPLTPHTLKRERNLGSRQYVHAFIRQFPDSMMQNPLVDIEFYARLALSLVEDRQELQFAASVPQTGTIELSHYRNLLLDKHETSNIQHTAVALGGEQNALLLSGPNMGGKTMTARGIGLAVLMNQLGLPLSDTAPKLSIFRNIYTVFPRSEQLQAGYGYFGTLVKEIAELVKRVGPGDLVILDEVPTGTDHDELVAVATVLTEDLIKTRATVIVTGHLKKAFELLAERTGQQPYQHTVTEVDGRVKPDFKLAPGIAKHSYAIELTREAGFPPEVTELARAYYAAIMEGRPLSETPTLQVVAQDAAQENPTETLPNDARMIQSVAESLFPVELFAFRDTQKQVMARILNESVSEEALKLLFDALGGGGFFRSRDRSKPDPKFEAMKRAVQESPEQRLKTTHVYMARGSDFLKGLTKRLSAVKRAIKREERWDAPIYDHAANLQQLQQFKEAFERLVTHAASLRADAQLTQMLDLLRGDAQEHMKTLADGFSKNEGEGLDPQKPEDRDKLNSLQTRWELGWLGLVEAVRPYFEKMDAYTGIARGVLQHGLKPPVFVDQPHTFRLNNSKPLFPQYHGPFIPNAVPQSFEINPSKPVFVLTGPNSSGKTVLMFNSRMNALLALRGFYVSGDLELSRFDEVYAFFGGENSTLHGESYFANVLHRYADMLKAVTPKSLVILDELHGTDNFEMAAIQIATLHALRQRGATVIFNTHIRDGLKLAADKIGLDFWKTDVTYDPATKTVTPHYTISPDPHLEAKSYGLAVASQWLSADQSRRAEELYRQLTGEPPPGSSPPSGPYSPPSSPTEPASSPGSSSLGASEWPEAGETEQAVRSTNATRDGV